VTRVVFPEREMAVRIAHSLVIERVDYIELSGDSRSWKCRRRRVLRQDAARHRPAGRFGLTTIAIKRTSKTGHGDFTTVSPGPDDVVQPGDTLASSAATSGSGSSRRC
jgi:Trk K+ transport system NAD-binding subunit